MTGIEIDFLAVGEGEKSGDAIAFRYGNLFGSRQDQTVCILDGGTKETGEQLVQHVRQYYGTSHVDIVFCSHLDTDHVSGLTEVVGNLTVGTLAMHRPWEHAAAICDLFRDGRLTPTGLENKLRKALAAARDLETLAERKGIPIVEPFQGMGQDGILTVLGPSLTYYQALLACYRCTPDPIAAIAALLGEAKTKARDAIRWVRESLDPATETLGDDGETSAENNSSLILHVKLPDFQFLFTGDAGIPALTAAADYAMALNMDLTALNGWQVPHHGSRRNVGPRILNRIRAPQAYISAAREGTPKHPARKVTNALKRRNTNVYVTAGTGIRRWHNAPARSGWDGTVAPVPFFNEVDE